MKIFIPVKLIDIKKCSKIEEGKYKCLDKKKRE